MIQYVYVVKDDIVGSFMPFGNHVNQAVAQRSFRFSCDPDGVPVADLSLYESGEFDTDTGIFHGYDTPRFIMRGEKNA